MIQTLAIDDEPPALKLLEGYIERCPFLNLSGAYSNPFQAMEAMQFQKVDLIFLDIRMPDMSGTEFARNITNGPKIVFTTAYEKYALDGFRLDAVDYLLKPFGYDEFLAAAQKVKKLIELEQKATRQVETRGDFLFLKSEYKTRRVNFDDIIYIEGLKEYVKVYLKNEPRPLLSLVSLKTLEAKLPEARFMRVHRSFIVNLNRVDTIERFRIVFGEVYIPVGDQYKEKFQQFLDENFI